MKPILTLLVFLTWSGVALPVAPDDAARLAAANNAFAFKLLQQVAKEEPAQNVFISPCSASTVLELVSGGAAGTTRTEMESVLGTTGMTPVEVGAGNQAIARALMRRNTNVILTTVNAVWHRQGAPAKPDFLAFGGKYFDATVAPMDFADPHSVEVINAWASEKTHGRITRIADGMIDPVYTQLFLANAVYFKGKWSDPFKPEDTKPHPFHLRGGGVKEVPMMSQSKTFTYRRGTGYQAVRLPYEGGHLGMYVFLPDTNSSPEKLLSLMSGDVWRRVTRPGFSEKEGVLRLPKFKVEDSVELTKTLPEMGMKAAFIMGKADFSGIARREDGLYISQAVQKTFIEVKEEGTEAAAVTGILANDGSGISEPKPKPFEMIVERPFMFLIADDQTGVILFMGLIFDPAAH